MKDILATINQIIKEHEVILQQITELDHVVNDAEALTSIDKAKEVFMPGRLDDNQGLQQLQDLCVRIEEGLNAHFKREEIQLLAAFQDHGDEKLANALRTLLLDHKELRNRLVHEKQCVSDLATRQLSRSIWEATAHDLRAHITHTRKLIEAHAESEQTLLHALRKEISDEQSGKS